METPRPAQPVPRDEIGETVIGPYAIYGGFRTPEGDFKTVILTHRPLGFKYTKKTLKVTEVKPGHEGEAQGLRVGWRMVSIDGEDLEEPVAGHEKLRQKAVKLPVREDGENHARQWSGENESTDVTVLWPDSEGEDNQIAVQRLVDPSENGQDARAHAFDAVFETPAGELKTVTLTQRPLGFKYTKTMLKVTEVKPGYEGEKQGLEVGWLLVSIAGEYIKGQPAFGHEKLRRRAGKLPVREDGESEAVQWVDNDSEDNQLAVQGPDDAGRDKGQEATQAHAFVVVFETPAGELRAMTLTQRPLGFRYTKRMLQVTEVKPGFEAERQGLEVGWFVVSVAGEGVKGQPALGHEKMRRRASKLPKRTDGEIEAGRTAL